MPAHHVTGRHTVARALVASAFALASLLSVAATPERPVPATAIDSQSFLFN